MMDETIRQSIVFYGWVQGVGFRYRARNAAALYGCIGWVRNDWDGSVTMEIQGAEAAIDKVLRYLETSRYIWIEKTDVTPLYPDPGERGFETD